MKKNKNINTSDSKRNVPETEGLKYRLNKDRSGYIVTGLGSVTDTQINIPSVYNGLPVVEIGELAFKGCTGITSIYIPNTVTSISDAFSSCTCLESIAVDSANKKYYSKGNCLIEKASKELIAGCKNSVIPNGVTSIGDSAFCGCAGLTSIIIPNSVTSIGGSAFEGCTGLTNITIPDRVTSIGNNAFRGCRGLTNIAIPNSVTSIGEGAFSNCAGLINFIIPDSVTSIGRSAFNGSSLINIIIGNGVVEIPDRAFHECWRLTSVIIPDTLLCIKEGAFEYCSKLKNIIIPSGVVLIERNAFYCCSSLTIINIPASLTSIGEDAFGMCSSLTEIILDKNNPNYYLEGNCLIERETKKLIRGFKDSYIPNDVIEIGSCAFYECKELTNIIIPNSVTSIERYAFSGCTGLTSITIPNNVTSISYHAFSDCNNLTYATFENINGWTADGHKFTSYELSKPAKAARELIEKYCNYKWTRSDSKYFTYF